MDWYSDGSGFNGKRAAFSVANEGGFLEIEEFTEPFTNNDMEYEGLIRALTLAEEGDTVYTDSQLVIGHLTKGWRCFALNLQPRLDKARAILEDKKVNIMWIGRDHNKAGWVFE
jgi:ribonuclease HI